MKVVISLILFSSLFGASAEPSSEVRRLQKLNEMLAPDAVPSEAEAKWRAEIAESIARNERMKAAERPQWFADRRAMVARAKETPDVQAIIDLSMIVRGIGPSLAGASSEGKQLFHEAQTTLLSIPGHAEYHGSRIMESRQRFEEFKNAGEANPIPPREGAMSMQNEHLFGFQTLSFLPSAETVRVLGEFLYDERGLHEPSGLSP